MSGHHYDGWTVPSNTVARAQWKVFMTAAKHLRDTMVDRVPDGPNKTEALVRLDKAVMVAQGSFHVHPR